MCRTRIKYSILSFLSSTDCMRRCNRCSPPFLCRFMQGERWLDLVKKWTLWKRQSLPSTPFEAFPTHKPTPLSLNSQNQQHNFLSLGLRPVPFLLKHTCSHHILYRLYCSFCLTISLGMKRRNGSRWIKYMIDCHNHVLGVFVHTTIPCATYVSNQSMPYMILPINDNDRIIPSSPCFLDPNRRSNDFIWLVGEALHTHHTKGKKGKWFC